MKDENLIKYHLPFGWEVSFPDNWMHEKINEEEHSEDVFWPESCEPTVRMSCLYVSKHGIRAPAVILKALSKLLFLNKKILPGDPIQGEHIKSFAYESQHLENGVPIHCLGVVSCTAGNILAAGIYSENLDICKDALRYVKLLKFNRK